MKKYAGGLDLYVKNELNIYYLYRGKAVVLFRFIGILVFVNNRYSIYRGNSLGIDNELKTILGHGKNINLLIILKKENSE
ncbi:hypothetical protein [Lysinibacillus sp. 3P01SB]|uniref:hypothetical protein n=1 Tax=Lysinibacillus sp. 3P01SB TaxID=3132284 RepID=UPI0039A5EC45